MSEWIKSNERLPNDHRKVIGYFYDINEYVVCDHVNGDWAETLTYEEIGQPDLWMDLIVPPPKD